MKDFGIVIPHLDYSEKLANCLWSIFLQEGSATVHCHIQDGGIDNSAERIVEEIISKVDPDRFFISYIREPDLNAANAINKGMATINAEMVTWLGADDFLMPGALQTIFSLRAQHPDIRWVTGLPHIVNEHGVAIPTHGSAGVYRRGVGYSREALRRGLFSGELNHGWIQQEGTFWERSLWETVGGLNESLKLAFDFDLWSKMAEQADLVEVVAPLGAFRKRPNQISADMTGYREEMAGVRRTCVSSAARPQSLASLEGTWVAFLDKKSNKWELLRGEFLIWFGAGLLPWFNVKSIRTTKSRVVRGFREKSASHLIPRVILIVWSALRQKFGLR